MHWNVHEYSIRSALRSDLFLLDADIFFSPFSSFFFFFLSIFSRSQLIQSSALSAHCLVDITHLTSYNDDMLPKIPMKRKKEDQDEGNDQDAEEGTARKKMSQDHSQKEQHEIEKQVSPLRPF